MKRKVIVLGLVGAGVIASGVAWYTGEHAFAGTAGATAVQTQAAPSAPKVENQLMATGHVTRSHLGVTVQEVDQKRANAFKLGRPTGALVSSVDKSGPAAIAGIEPGDVILGVNGAHVTSPEQVRSLLAKAGKSVAPQVQRDQEKMFVAIELG